MHTHTHTHTHARTHTHTHACTHTHIHKVLITHIHTCMCTHTQSSHHTHTHTHTYTHKVLIAHTHTSTHMHARTHTHTKLSSHTHSYHTHTHTQAHTNAHTHKGLIHFLTISSSWKWVALASACSSCWDRWLYWSLMAARLALVSSTVFCTSGCSVCPTRPISMSPVCCTSSRSACDASMSSFSACMSHTHTHTEDLSQWSWDHQCGSFVPINVFLSQAWCIQMASEVQGLVSWAFRGQSVALKKGFVQNASSQFCLRFKNNNFTLQNESPSPQPCKTDLSFFLSPYSGFHKFSYSTYYTSLLAHYNLLFHLYLHLMANLWQHSSVQWVFQVALPPSLKQHL